MTISKKKPLDTERKQTRWTIMVYIAADNSLANFAVESLKQLHNSVSMKGTPIDQKNVMSIDRTSSARPLDQAKVVVAAQFAINAPGGQQIPRYIFNEHSDGNLGNSLRQRLNAQSIKLVRACCSVIPSGAFRR